MGRQIRRVALDFDWPMNQVWKGFVFPYQAAECYGCKGNEHGKGYSKEADELSAKWYGFGNEDWEYEPSGRRHNKNALQYNLDSDDVQALLDADRLWDFTRNPINDEQREVVRKKVESGENSWLPYNNGYVPTPEAVNHWAIHSMGHDSLNESVVIRARLEKLGISDICMVCGGSGQLWQSDEIEKASEAWESIDPPVGEGWQLWETVSEGSPISPVFASKEELVDYMVKGDGWSHEWTRSQAEAMVEEGFTLSGLAVGGKFMRAEEAVEYQHKHRDQLPPVRD